MVGPTSTVNDNKIQQIVEGSELRCLGVGTAEAVTGLLVRVTVFMWDLKDE